MQLDIELALPLSVQEFGSYHIYGLKEDKWGLDPKASGVGRVFFKLDDDQCSALELSEHDVIQGRFHFDPALLERGREHIFDSIRFSCYMGDTSVFAEASLSPDHRDALVSRCTTIELEGMLIKVEQARRSSYWKPGAGTDVDIGTMSNEL